MGGLCCCADDDESTTPLIQDDEEARKTYEKFIKNCFRAFCGSSEHSKKSVYMNRTELNAFLTIFNLYENMEVEQVFKLIDSEVDDNRIQLNEFYEHFTQPLVNPSAGKLRRQIEQHENYIILIRTLTIFEEVDKDKGGKLESGEIAKFAKVQFDYTDEECVELWNELDADGSGAVTIVELFGWFKKATQDQDNSPDNDDNE